ncbi:hypothetical protein BKA64DRAFT_670979 [Cadophora sp. MPI-SDFR-AT-0126]|nr:hypothetical protein BKA64DRAFT_670979 [Leotiomycetes sp. MPI-SDFR-AT-0126]
MDQEEERREKGRGRGHRNSGNNENKNEKASRKGQPARVVLKSNSSAYKTTPRITLRAQETTPKISATMRETPPSKKEASPSTRQTFSSLRTTPSSHMKGHSPAAKSQVNSRENASRSARDNKAGQRQQISARSFPSVKTDQKVSRKETFVVNRKVSENSEEGSDWTLTPIPQPASIREDSFTAPNSPDVSSGDELGIITQVDNSPVYADGELSGDDLESRMRSFLRRRERSRVSRRSEIKSVKWDPAIVACGSLTPITNKSKASENHASRVPQECQLEEPTKDFESSLDNLNKIAADLKKADRRILHQLLEALQNVDSSDDTTIVRPKKARVPLAEQNVKDNRRTTSKSPEQTNSTLAVKGLNPEAPVYRNFAPVKTCFSPQKGNTETKENIPQGGKWPLNVQRNRPHSADDGKDNRLSIHDPAKPNKYIPPALRTRKTRSMAEQENNEPIWIKTSPPYSVLPSQEDIDQPGGISNSQEALLNAPLDPMYALQTPALQTPLLAQPSRAPLHHQTVPPPSWMTGFQTLQQQQFSQPMVPFGFYTPYGGFGLPPNIVPSLLLSPDWYPVPMVPLPTVSTQPDQFPTHSQQPAKNLKNHTKRLPVNVIPSETGPGRTAITLEPAWATQVLEKFTAKYPKTGTKKPLPKPTKEKKVATKIQQRLEVLLLYQKEKKALEENFGHAAGLALPRHASLVSSGTSSIDSLDASIEMS